ncbi:TonB-dependent receptor [Aurantibacter crassamenti]|uniref:SusC/RagA family TonB-linked outer membrane protein n=1 Tax=Aurantibacter crassamenti TaxID=1837375 RepID=UPI00193A6AFF|nr:TonB-dependent receptor [Aurantibacter crassamenti]MBM1105768.1 TonB-dependent receptor [Aurantibacter crassamenti]
MKTTLLKRLLLFGAFLCFSTISAQTVSGTVTDSSGPLPGASVVIKGTTNGTQVDFDGNYSLDNVDNSATLVISYIGFATQEVAVNGQGTINVTLTEDASQLEEVVVVGYGTQKRANITGAVAKVGGDEVAAIQAARVDDALAGKLPGVLIQNQSGEPGADPKIQIRAASSLSGDSSPLIVVDGYPISGSLATVNPNDIQSLEVLKDAASAAIYGSRGANGVILVTTKQGRAGKAKFSYNAYTSFSRKYVGDIEMLKTPGEWADELETSAYDLSEIDPLLLNYRQNALRNAPDVVSMEEWLFKNGSTQSHDFSVSGGSEDLRAFASVGYMKTDGIVIGQGFERMNARLNVDANLGEKIQAGVSFNGFYGKQDIVPHEMRDLLRSYSIHPIYHTQASIDFVQQLDGQRQALFDSGFTGNNFGNTFDNGYRGTGNITSSIYDLQPGEIAHEWHYGREQNGIGGSGDAGPAAKYDNARRYQTNYFGNASTFLQYELFDGLKIKTVLGGDFRDTETYFYQGTLADARERSNQSDLDISNIRRSSVLSETTLSYTKVIGKHDIAAVGGYELQNNYIKGISSVGTNVPIGLPQNYGLFNPADVISTEIDETRSRRSVFGRLQYAFDDRYLLTASIRRDGDSRFGANQRFATFPALSVGWNIHNESFLKGNETLSQFKLRFSTGSLGTTSFLGSYDALSLLSAAPTSTGTGFLIPNNVANPDLTWQTNTETNYGTDLGFFNNRLRLGVDYYTSDIEDMLINQSVSEVFGVPSVVLNRGNITSSGLELELNASIIQKEDFSWSIGANLSTVNQEITSLGDLDELPSVVYGGPSGRGPQFRNYVGGELGEMWGYAVTGEVETIHIADPSRNIGYGSSEWYVVDQNGDGEIDEDNDYVKLGSATPDFYWGFSSNLNYKAFDLAIQFQGSQGAEVYNIDPIYWKSQFGGRLRDSFDANGDGIADASGKHYQQTRNAHGSGIQDASYLALRNLTLGYTLDSELTSKIGLSSLRIYAAGTNLLYLFGDNYTSFNPEGVEIENGGYLGPTTYGYQEGASPIVRSFTLGLNVNF